MTDKPSITGQLMFWDKGPQGPDPLRHVVQVFGVLGLPPELAKEFCRDETLKHMVYGERSALGLKLVASADMTEALPEYYQKGQSPDRLFTSPVWRM